MSNAELLQAIDEFRQHRAIAADCVTGLEGALARGEFGPNTFELLVAGPRAKLREQDALCLAAELVLAKGNQQEIDAALEEAKAARLEAEGIAEMLFHGAPVGGPH